MQSVYLLPRKKLDVGRILMMFVFPANFSAILTEKFRETNKYLHIEMQ